MLLLATLTSVVVSPPTQATPAWLPGVTDLSAAGEHADLPQVATARDGTITVVWRRLDGTHEIVQATTRSPGGTWTAPADLSAAGQHADLPQVATAPDGTTTVVWNRFDGANQIVQATTRSPGGTWTAPTDLSAAGQDALRAQVVVDGQGIATAVWHRFDGTHWIVQAATRSPYGWTAPTDLSTAGQSAFEAQIAAAADGTTTVVWRRYDAMNYIVQATTRSPGGTWTTPTDLSLAGNSGWSPAVAAAPDGTATVVWCGFTESLAGYVVQASTRSPGSTWSTPTELSAEGHDAVSPQVTAAPDGTTTAVWHRFDGANEIVQAATRSLYGWTAPADLSAAARDALSPQVVTAPDGTSTAVWHRFDGTHWIVQSATRSPGGTWSTPTDLSALGQSAYEPQVAAAPDGTTIAVWYRFDGTDWIVQARAFDAGSPTILGIGAPSTGTTGEALGFTAAATDSWSVPTLGWDFGDGVTATGPVVAHAYAAVGAYTVKVTATDAVGNATARIAGNVTISAAPAPSTAPPATPRITAFRLTRKTISIAHVPRVTKAVIGLTARAKVTLTFKKKTSTKKLRKIVRLDAGTTRVRITARLTKKIRLKPGVYTVKAVASNDYGVSAPRKAQLRVTR